MAGSLSAHLWSAHMHDLSSTCNTPCWRQLRPFTPRHPTLTGAHTLLILDAMATRGQICRPSTQVLS